jgi:hypothetical protein
MCSLLIGETANALVGHTMVDASFQQTQTPPAPSSGAGTTWGASSFHGPDHQPDPLTVLSVPTLLATTVYSSPANSYLARRRLRSQSKRGTSDDSLPLQPASVIHGRNQCLGMR